MKMLFSAFVLILSLSAFAENKMGEEAVEMFQLMNHYQVKKCLDSAPSHLINIKIEKTVYRCPGCTTYKITGNELNIDVPSTEKAVITLQGKAVPGFGHGWIQTYQCDVTTK